MPLAALPTARRAARALASSPWLLLGAWLLWAAPGARASAPQGPPIAPDAFDDPDFTQSFGAACRVSMPAAQCACVLAEARAAFAGPSPPQALTEPLLLGWVRACAAAPAAQAHLARARYAPACPSPPHGPGCWWARDLSEAEARGAPAVRCVGGLQGTRGCGYAWAAAWVESAARGLPPWAVAVEVGGALPSPPPLPPLLLPKPPPLPVSPQALARAWEAPLGQAQAQAVTQGEGRRARARAALPTAEVLGGAPQRGRGAWDVLWDAHALAADGALPLDEALALARQVQPLAGYVEGLPGFDEAAAQRIVWLAWASGGAQALPARGLVAARVEAARGAHAARREARARAHWVRAALWAHLLGW